MNWQVLIEIALGAVVSLLGWSLKQNVAAFGRTLEEVRNEVRSLAATVGTHTTQLGVLDARVAELSRRVDGIENRERNRAA